MIKHSFAIRAVQYAVLISFAIHCFLLFQTTIRNVDSNQSLPSYADMTSYRFLTKERQYYNDDNPILGQRTTDTMKPRKYGYIPLNELVKSDPDDTCEKYNNNNNNNKHNFTLMESIVLDESITHPKNRKIPRIIHMTSKSRCMHNNFVDNINKWKFTNYSFYFHNDAAMNQLLQTKYWPEFPNLQLMQHCTLAGAQKADLWRLLILWEYGGIYTDIDNAPGPAFQNGTAITDDDDSFFVIERIGTLSQYFMAASPKHPLIHIAITETLKRILEVTSIGAQNVAWVSGPEAIRQSMIIFMRSEGRPDQYQYIKKGKCDFTDLLLALQIFCWGHEPKKR